MSPGRRWTAADPTRRARLDAVARVLTEVGGRRLLGPGPVADQVDHALGVVDALEALVGGPTGPALGVDLGTGAGLPGLALAAWWPGSRWVLLDAATRSVRAVRAALAVLDWEDRVEVRHGRAEDLAREPALRGRADLVVARGFGPPAVAAECAVGFAAADGTVAVSEPPGGDPGRWSEAGLARLGLNFLGVHPGPPAYAVLRATAGPPEGVPRRAGVPERRPYF